jgi:hypothetical protein
MDKDPSFMTLEEIGQLLLEAVVRNGGKFEDLSRLRDRTVADQAARAILGSTGRRPWKQVGGL